MLHLQCNTLLDKFLQLRKQGTFSKNKFTNGPELKNKFIHSNYSKEIKVQQEDFMRFQKMFC